MSGTDRFSMSQLQRQLEEELNSIPPWQYEKIVDRWSEVLNFVDVRNVPFGDREVFHADLAQAE